MSISPLLLVLEVWHVKPSCRKSWAGNLLMWSDLALGLSFKVKRWFTGFGELTLRAIQLPSVQLQKVQPGGIYYRNIQFVYMKGVFRSNIKNTVVFIFLCTVVVLAFNFSFTVTLLCNSIELIKQSIIARFPLSEILRI